MNVKELVRDLNVLPTAFTVESIRYEIETTPDSKGGYICFVWQMDGASRVQVYTFTHGATKEDAEQKMKQHILKL